MVAQLIKTKTLTPEEYLTIEVTSPDRHEYRNGEMTIMPGGKPNHNDIGGNFYIALKIALRKEPYRVFYADQRLWLPDAQIYAYPDVMVLQKPIELQIGRSDTVMNAVAIVEVLSTSTQDYDRGEKFVAYRSMLDFQDYVLVDQTKVYVEHYQKTASNQWLLTVHTDEADCMTLKSCGISIVITDLYEGIEL
jgi:Uma2 family endonuclease